MATKTFPYAVIWNGEIIPANTPIEIVSESEKPEKPTKKAVKKNVANGGTTDEP